MKRRVDSVPRVKCQLDLINKLTLGRVTSSNIYYGWWLVGAAVVCQFTFLSVGQVVVGVLMGPVVDEMGWKVWQFTLGSSIGTAMGALSGIIAGPILDRKGPRPILLLGAVICSLCLCGLAIQSSLWLFWSLSVLNGLLGWSFFGPVVVSSALTKWFVRKRGWALSIGSTGVSLGGLITPLVMTAVVAWFGWRGGYMALAVFVAVAIIPIALIMRRQPEDHGLLPDGDSTNSESIVEAANKSFSNERSLTLSHAIRTRAFWQLAIGFGLNQAALMSVLIYAFPFITESGFDRSVAAVGLSINGFGNLVSKIAWGWGLSRFAPRFLVPVAFGVSATGVMLILTAGSFDLGLILMVGFFLYGFGFGGTIPLSTFTWAHYFGRGYIGAIQGAGNPISVLLTAVAQVTIGVWFDVTGTYHWAFIAIFASLISAAALVAASKAPEG